MREEILELINREPFLPFRIVTTSGSDYAVENPNLVAMGQTLMHVFFPRSDRYATLRLTEVVATEVGGAGKTGRRRS
jgi:hypothetical protein